MKVVVFGGSGFLGSHVVDALLKCGYEVLVFDRMESPYVPSINMVKGDLLDRELIRSTLKGIDFVYVFAGIADIQYAANNPIETVQYNILGTTYILDACKEFGIKRILFSSSIYVYGEHASFYRSSKQAAELLIENYRQIYNLDFTILRYGSLYGPRANDFNFIKKLIKQAIIEKKIKRDGDGSEIREYIHVIDAAIASVDMLSDEYRNEYVMITGNQTLSIKQLINLVNEIMNEQIAIEYTEYRDEAHYKITPYSFKPHVARKHIINDYHDLGQGILECIYEIHDQIESQK